MRYSRNQLNDAGEVIMSSYNDESLLGPALEKVIKWRHDHLTPLSRLAVELENLLSVNKIKPFLISHRLKRFTSIVHKLDRNPQMRLGGMHDVGGYRIVVDDVDTLLRLQKLLDEEPMKNCFESLKPYDYVKNPKDSGYRSIHYRYKYKSTDKVHDGLRVELQIRTRLQHSWATAVETAGLYKNSQLKAEQGDSIWLDFFRIVSSLFAIKEDLPVLAEHNSMELQELMMICYSIEKLENISSILRALRVTVSKVTDDNGEYAIVYIDLLKRRVRILNYGKGELEQAMGKYAELESKVKEGESAVVMVHVNSIMDLKKAYPSYFLDTTEFISAIETIKSNCEKYYIA